MAKVTVEGSRTTPTTYLAAGKRMTVDRSPLLDKMIRRGYVRVVEDVPATAHVEQIVTEARVAADTERELSGAPARNASWETWAEFLDQEGVSYEEADTRNALISRWDNRAHASAPEESEDDGDVTD